jgi:hypothetical protein
MTIREWFYQLFHFRSLLEEKRSQVEYLEDKIADLKKAIRVRDYALESLGTPEVSPEEEKKPLRTFQPRHSYREMQRQYELGNHRQVREHLNAIEAMRRRQAK